MATKMSKEDPNPAGSVSNWPLGPGPVSQDYGSADPDLKGSTKTAFYYAPPAHQDFHLIPILLSQNFSSLQTLYKVNVSTVQVYMPCSLSSQIKLQVVAIHEYFVLS
jgi:hypothetical protein